MSGQENPIFIPVGNYLVKCNIDPKLCKVRTLIKHSNPPKHLCWHNASPEPNHEVTDKSYRICITEVKN